MDKNIINQIHFINTTSKQCLEYLEENNIKMVKLAIKGIIQASESIGYDPYEIQTIGEGQYIKTVNKHFYLCGENTLCMTNEPCSKGKELSGCPSGTLQDRETKRSKEGKIGYYREFEPCGFKVHLKFVDGTEEIRHTALDFKKGCNDQERT
jgi:hypothetical protein